MPSSVAVSLRYSSSAIPAKLECTGVMACPAGTSAAHQGRQVWRSSIDGCSYALAKYTHQAFIVYSLSSVYIQVNKSPPSAQSRALRGALPGCVILASAKTQRAASALQKVQALLAPPHSSPILQEQTSSVVVPDSSSNHLKPLQRLILYPIPKSSTSHFQAPRSLQFLLPCHSPAILPPSCTAGLDRRSSDDIPPNRPPTSILDSFQHLLLGPDRQLV